MSDQPENDIVSLKTTAQILRKTTTTALFSPSSFLTILLLSLSLYTFRSLIETGAHSITTFIDNDPSLKPLLSHLTATPSAPQHHQRSRRRPFFHLTRVGTLDDDFFSGEDELDVYTQKPSGKLPINASEVNFNGFVSGFEIGDVVVDNGVRVLQVVRTGIQFKVVNISETSEGNEEIERNDEMGGEYNDEKREKVRELERVVEEFQVLIKGLEMGRRDAVALFFLVSFLSAAYGWVILGFTVIYSWILGVVFVSVVNNLLGKFDSFVGVVFDGSRLGFKRATGFILMRWAVRDALTQLVGLWYFSEVEDQYSFFKLFLRLKLMPFSVMSPWIHGYEKEISGFMFMWSLLDTAVGLVFAVDAWVTVVDFRRTGREIVKEGLYLVTTMFNQAVQLKFIEAIVCGSFARWTLEKVLGKSLAAIFQSVMEVYFMVAWLIFYFAARCKEAHSEGRRFGRGELEGLIDGLR